MARLLAGKNFSTAYLILLTMRFWRHFVAHMPHMRHLRVVQTQAVLFLKPMSERGGYDKQRL